MLGDDVALREVRFQAAATPVDDFVLTGNARAGAHRRLSIAVRRAPSFVASDVPTVKLLADFIQVVTSEWEEIAAGTWRLGLVVANRRSIDEVAVLCDIARAAGAASTFARDVEIPRRTTASVRTRLGYFTAAVTKASEGLGLTSVSSDELTWRILSSLGVGDVHLEGADTSSRTAAVARLRTAVLDEDLHAADEVFGRLVELSQRYGPTASTVDLPHLRRDLAGFPLARTRSMRPQWDKLERYSDRASERTGFRLEQGATVLELPRSALLDALSGLVRRVPANQATVVVGEPDVGKSSLVLNVARGLRESGVDVVVLSLRDLPERIGQFESELETDLDTLFASAMTARGRLLVIDGAEAVLQGYDLILRAVATAALRQGFGVVAVSRSDGATAVTEALAEVSRNCGLGEPLNYAVPPLSGEEVDEVGRTFPQVSSLLGNERTARLLARPGLLDLVLQAGSPEALSGPLAEIDVFNVTWMTLVRRDEMSAPGGPTPDAREQVLLALARRELGGSGPDTIPDSTALPSLRVDGLLLPVHDAWTTGPEFASDLIRDFSLARLFLAEGWPPLEAADARRWVIRAVRLACQGRFQRAGPDREEELQRLTSEMAGVADRHGQRWAEVPMEALLTLGDARDALFEAWPWLIGSGRDQLSILLRLAEQRHTNVGVGDADLLSPLVELAFCGGADLGQHDRYSRLDTGDQIRRLVLAWLNGLAVRGVAPTQIRQQVRDVILEQKPEPYDEFAVTALASLGPDLDDRVEDFLLRLASDGGAHLAPVVEEFGPIIAMSSTRPDLLITLADAYYIKPERRRRRGDDFDDWDYLDDGIRSHHGSRGIGDRLAAWYYGPFFRLLNEQPREAVALVNRMLDRAASVEVSDRERRPEPTDKGALPGLDLGLGTIGPRRCVGSPRAWMWYRGSSTGPTPCVSALLAVERFADYLVSNVGVPATSVAELLMRDCHNLAMPGLIAGLLIRHGVLEPLDQWLELPELWHVEFNRLASEGILHIQGPDDETVVGRERRRHTFREVAAEMTIHAVTRNDQERVAALGRIADALFANARGLFGDSDDADESIAMVEGWASTFRQENMGFRPTTDGNVEISFAPPTSVASRLKPSQMEIERRGDAVRLLNLYAHDEARVATTEDINEDLVVGRRLADSVTGRDSFLDGRDPIAALAAAAVVAAAGEAVDIAPEDLDWACQILVVAATEPHVDQFSIPESFFGQGADRSAGAALPSAGLVWDMPHEEVERYTGALTASGRSLFDEVRAAMVVGARRVWMAPCRDIGGTCLHVLVWQSIVAGLADTRLGDWDEQGHRSPDPLAGPYEESLPLVETDRIYLNRVNHPLIAAWDASSSGACVAASAGQLFPVLVDTHCRAAAHWAEERYGHFGDRDRRRVAGVLIRAAAAGHPAHLTAHLDEFAGNGVALQQLLMDMSIVYTYDAELRTSLPVVWPASMDVVLDAWELGRRPEPRDHWLEYAIGHLLPTPMIETADTDIDSTLAAARAAWISPRVLDERIDRWVPFAEREPRAVDALVQLAECGDLDWQTSRGLEIVEQMVSAGYDEVASRTWHLTEWLKIVRQSGLDSEAIRRWHRIVDGLATAGDSRAARLQLAEE